MATIQAEALYKVFGRDPQRIVSALEGGRERSEVETSGATAAVIDANFEVYDGECFVVMGLSGSGKSTLLRMLNGLLPVTAGTVHVNGENLTAMSVSEARELRCRTMSMVFQHFALFPHRTVVDNAAYGLGVQGMGKKQRREKARDALALTGLEGWDDHLPDQLSGGMQQRVGLARALAAETDVLLMDEAFSALDPLIRREMQDQLVILQKKLAKTVIFITHDLNEAMRLGDRIAIMRDGRIVQIGTVRDILDEPANDYVAEFVQDVDRTRVLTASMVMGQDGPIVSRTASATELEAAASRQKSSSVLVVDDDHRLVGAVDAILAAADSAIRVDGPLVDIRADLAIDKDVVRASPDDTVRSLLTASARSPHPIAVVDDGVLLGTITQEQLLRAAGGRDRANGGARR